MVSCKVEVDVEEQMRTGLHEDLHLVSAATDVDCLPQLVADVKESTKEKSPFDGAVP